MVGSSSGRSGFKTGTGTHSDAEFTDDLTQSAGASPVLKLPLITAARAQIPVSAAEAEPMEHGLPVYAELSRQCRMAKASRRES